MGPLYQCSTLEIDQLWSTNLIIYMEKGLSNGKFPHLMTANAAAQAHLQITVDW